MLNTFLYDEQEPSLFYRVVKKGNSKEYKI